jgi:hypothetical protein
MVILQRCTANLNGTVALPGNFLTDVWRISTCLLPVENLLTSQGIQIGVGATNFGQELLPIPLAFVVTIAMVTREDSIRDMITAATLEVVQMRGTVLPVEMATAVCAPRPKMRPHVCYLILGRIKINCFFQSAPDVILSLRQRMITHAKPPVLERRIETLKL